MPCTTGSLGLSFPSMRLHIYTAELVRTSYRGAWIFRGQEIPKIMLDECYDMELYNWRKADLSDEVGSM